MRPSRSAALLAGLAACAPSENGRALKPQDPAPPPVRVEKPDDLPEDLGERAFAHAKALVGFGPRHAGVPGWERSVDYIAAQLEGVGLTPRRDRWTEPGEGITFENVSAVIRGSVPDRIVIGCHHDTKVTSGHEGEPEHNFPFVGANDSASGVGLLLELAHWLAAHPPRATVEVVFFDGEESLPFDWDLARALFGSRRFVAAYEAARKRDRLVPPIRAMILLDMVGAEDLTIDDETRSDRVLQRIFAAAAEACGHAAYFFEHQLSVADDHVPFLDAGIPAIDLIDIHDNPQWHTADDTLEHLSPRSFQIVGEVVLTALPAVEERFVPNLR